MNIRLFELARDVHNTFAETLPLWQPFKEKVDGFSDLDVFSMFSYGNLVARLTLLEDKHHFSVNVDFISIEYSRPCTKFFFVIHEKIKEVTERSIYFSFDSDQLGYIKKEFATNLKSKSNLHLQIDGYY